jgi:hypothetical protein
MSMANRPALAGGSKTCSEADGVGGAGDAAGAGELVGAAEVGADGCDWSVAYGVVAESIGVAEGPGVGSGATAGAAPRHAAASDPARSNHESLTTPMPLTAAARGRNEHDPA